MAHGQPGACCCAGRHYRWRAGLGNANLSVGLKRLIYSLKYRAKRPGQSGVREKGETWQVEQRRNEEHLGCDVGSLQPSRRSAFCLLLICLGLPEAITTEYGRQPAGWHLLVPDNRLPLGRGGGEGDGWAAIGSIQQEVNAEGWRRRRRR